MPESPGRLPPETNKYGQVKDDGIKEPFYPQHKIRMGGDLLGSVIKKRRKKMRKHKHRKLLARTRHQRRKGK
jgi:Mitochondrial mRNA-processing protein COX24, C-terminal